MFGVFDALLLCTLMGCSCGVLVAFGGAGEGEGLAELAGGSLADSTGDTSWMSTAERWLSKGEDNAVALLDEGKTRLCVLGFADTCSARVLGGDFPALKGRGEVRGEGRGDFRSSR